MSSPTLSSRLVPPIPAVTVTALGAVATFALARVLWPDPAGAPTPSADLLPFFLLLSVAESVVFGLGLAFLAFGLAPLRRAKAGAALTWAAYLSIGFMLLSWWPHDNMHRVLSHGDFAGLVQIEYLFHAPLIAAAVIVAAFFLRSVGGRRADA
ncbi:hypothetical protein [Dactylosporangium sp. NPDC048998]|uniref:hypothetical protein n=1 Tax=Dactylosporangium sp. NPDC048998 TaxID=3363976 RepID=UPI0037159C3C